MFDEFKISLATHVVSDSAHNSILYKSLISLSSNQCDKIFRCSMQNNNNVRNTIYESRIVCCVVWKYIDDFTNK